MITIGGKKIKAISWDGKAVKKIATTDGKIIWQKNYLSEGYKECDYIENTSLLWVDTGVLYNNSKIEMSITPNIAINDNYAIFGSRKANLKPSFTLFTESNGGYYYQNDH